MSAIPKSVQYQAGGLPVTVSSRRSTVRLTPVNSGTYTPEDGGVIRFEFPRTLGWLDTSQSFFSFNFRFTDGNASKTTFTPDSHDTLKKKKKLSFRQWSKELSVALSPRPDQFCYCVKKAWWSNRC
jgi:hypothetical protein